MATLNPLERILHTLTRMVLSDRRMRIGFMCYAVGLHVVVLLMLFEFSLR
jgi:homeobox protein cut-like